MLELRETLLLRRKERDKLLLQMHRAMESDSRIGAAWLCGSTARGTTDALSDLDVTAVVRDETMTAIAGDPAKPVDYRRVLTSPRGRWVRQIAAPLEPLLLLEAPQNAPDGGAFLTSFFAGEAGPQQVDWEWVPASTARLPRESALLFDRLGVPRQTERSAAGQPGPAPVRTPFEVAAHAVPWFWATLLWNAKHAARSPRGIHMPLLRQTVGAVRDVEQFVDASVGPVVVEPIVQHPDDRVRILVELARQMAGLMVRASALGADIPADLVAQVRRYLNLVEQIIISA